MAMPVQNSKISDAIKVISEQGFQGMAEVIAGEKIKPFFQKVKI